MAIKAKEILLIYQEQFVKILLAHQRLKYYTVSVDLTPDIAISSILLNVTF